MIACATDTLGKQQTRYFVSSLHYQSLSLTTQTQLCTTTQTLVIFLVGIADATILSSSKIFHLTITLSGGILSSTDKGTKHQHYPQHTLNNISAFILTKLQHYNMAAFDHPDTIRHFLTQMNSQPKHMNLNNITSSITTPNDQPANGHDSTIHTAADNDNSEYNKSEGAMTPLVPPRSTLASQDHHQHWTSPEAHPKPSPHLSGLKAPQNTPKTAASSPRLAAINIHNQDVADAFSEYVNNMDGRPLSESIWAPASAPQKPSMLGGARSTSVLTPIKAVVPNPAINDTFDRMTFKAADTDHNAGKNLIGDRVTRSLYSNVPASFINKSCVLADKVHGDTTDHGQAKPEAAGDEGLESPAYTKTVDKGQVKEDGAVSKNTPNTTHSDHVEKENDTRSTSTAYLPPHLRAVRGSGTRVPAQNLSQSSPSESSRTHSSSDQKPATSESSVKTETDSLGTEGFPLPVTSKVADPGPVKDIVQAATNDAGTEVTIDTAGAKPLTDTSSASEDLEGKIFFDVWPKGEERSRPGMLAEILLSSEC